MAAAEEAGWLFKAPAAVGLTPTWNGALAQAPLTYIVRVMAERLSFASKVIGVLRR